jgi:hypothetical protein
LDGLFCELEASSVTWTYFMEAYTVTRRTVKFRYIHMMTPDDKGPRRENISRARTG